MRTERERLKAEVERLTESVAQLRRMGLEAAVQAASTEVAELSGDVALFEAMAGSLQNARHALDTAASSLHKVQRARGVEDLGRKIDELGRQTQSLEAEYRRATNQELPADLEARIGNIEQVTRELRRGSAASRQGWFGRWFGGSRS